jgi:hypothetical protein
MFSKISRRLQRSAIDAKQKRARLAIVRPANVAAAEFLEQRCLFDAAPFSITEATLSGPSIVPGTKYTYQQIASNGTVAVHKLTVDPKTTHNGNSVFPIVDEITTTTADLPPKIFSGALTSYNAVVSGALVTYDANVVNDTAGSTATITNTPYETALPPTLVLGQSYTFTYTQTTVATPSGMDPTTTTNTITDVLTLASAQTQSITVPKGTFDCYEVDVSETVVPEGNFTPGPPDQSKIYYAPGVGSVERLDLTDPSTGALKLVDFASDADTLSFKPGGSPTAAGENIKPPVVVDILDSTGNLDSTGDDSTDKITLTLSSGTLNGTLTVAAVGGVATFSDLSIPTAGTYTLTATGDSVVSKTSDPFTISVGEPAELTPTLPRLDVPTSAVGGGKVNINASITVTNNTASTVTGTAKVSAVLVGPNGVSSAVVRLGDSFTASPADTVSLPVGKTVSQKVNLKAHKAGFLKIHITSLPNVQVAGNYSLDFIVTDPKGNSVTLIGPTIAVGPAVITLTETVSALKLPSTITIGQKLKAASIKLIVKNSGNVIAKGKTTFSVSASTTAGVAGAPIATSSVVLNTAPGKTKPVSITIKSLPTLTAGSYFIVVQATDSMGNKSFVSSALQIIVTA